MVYKSFVGSLVLDTFFYAALRKTLELTVGIDVLMVASVRVVFWRKPYREVVFLQSFVYLLVPDTFFYAALRKTLELTEEFVLS
ncbi:hypothetical protein [Chryseobacterium sp. Leaf394]|uniref:hypothetical protein n=1 Tax=Chryseobacterium sp. Leaf394 TaxID=1736361 RepID=UPI000FF8A8FE|nr:hypothetical protein [Chryseobacterium sp. Leaf394]